MSDYYGTHYANVHAIGHTLLADVIFASHIVNSNNLGESNARVILRSLVNNLRLAKSEEQQTEGALDFAYALLETFVQDATDVEGNLTKKWARERTMLKVMIRRLHNEVSIYYKIDRYFG